MPNGEKRRRNMTRLTQARNTATAPHCHCQSWAERRWTQKYLKQGKIIHGIKYQLEVLKSNGIGTPRNAYKNIDSTATVFIPRSSILIKWIPLRLFFVVCAQNITSYETKRMCLACLFPSIVLHLLALFSVLVVCL